ncbi:MAG: ATP synthase F1 subunit delta [Clostridia bacterium]|nr:ATP synthase F1 subunit delta [Clostridia bacterium]
MTTETCHEYAEALYALAAEKNQEKAYLEALETAVCLLTDNPAYMELLACPAIPRDERDALLEQSFGQILPTQVVTFIQLLCAHRRIRSLKDCLEEYRLMYQTAAAMSTAQVISAVPLTEQEKERLAAALSARFGRTITLECTVDESLLGGLTVRVDGKVLDGSLRHRLHTVKEVMKQ